MIKLENVTLLAISSNRADGNIAALNHCMKLIEFKAVKFLSHKKPQDLPQGIDFEFCPEIKSIYNFDCYAFLELGKHINTSHMLMVQDHAYILRPNLWDDAWLNYDFIGAPWPERPDFISVSTGEMVRVGNGGFSLRSKRLLDLPKRLMLPVVSDRGYTNDDGLINSFYRKIFLENGIKYAPVEVAAKFSYENPIPENKDIYPFGFHRYQK